MCQFHIVLLDSDYIVARYQILWSLLVEDVQGQQWDCSRPLRQLQSLLPLGCWRFGSLHHKGNVDFLGPCNGGSGGVRGAGSMW